MAAHQNQAVAPNLKAPTLANTKGHRINSSQGQLSLNQGSCLYNAFHPVKWLWQLYCENIGPTREHKLLPSSFLVEYLLRNLFCTCLFQVCGNHQEVFLKEMKHFYLLCHIRSNYFKVRSKQYSSLCCYQPSGNDDLTSSLHMVPVSSMLHLLRTESVFWYPWGTTHKLVQNEQ